MSLAFASAAVVAIACGKSKPTGTTAMNADLKRDLQLASASPTLQINPDEVAPQSKHELALKPKEAAHAPKVIRTDHPTIKASAKRAEAAEIKTDIPQVQVMASAPAPSESPTPDAPPLARPSPVPVQSYPTAAPIPANAGSSSGSIFGGAVIRGGTIGDDDHCDPHAPHRGGRAIGGIRGIPGGFPIGMGRSRFP
jgi:hypothetical protein